MAEIEITLINPTTYEVELPSGDKVEIGDKESTDFKPHLKLNRWGSECFIKVGLPTTEKPSPVVEADKVKWRGQKVEVRFYPLEPRTVIVKDKDGRDRQFEQNERGGFEFEIVLKEKPAKNEIVLDIDAKGLRFSYQPPLTQEEIDRGDIRPDNVEGSYAVYHATKKNNQYMTGKAFHIYRPHLIDALGAKAWADLNLSNSTLTITLPQDFMDSAVYPVTIDPEFGEQGEGGSWANIADETDSGRVGSAWTMPVGGPFVANYIRAYILGTSDPTDCKVFINEKDSGGAGTHGQIATKENLNCVAATHWEEFTLASEPLTSGVDYILNIVAKPPASGLYQVAYDANTAVASYWETPHNYAAPESPWVIGSMDPTVFDFSIYCNYTEAPVGWTGKIAGVTNPAKVMGVDVANIAKVKGVASA